jgi:hypothetical protein
MVRRLLIGIGELEQGWLAVWPTKERDTGRQIVGGEPRRTVIEAAYTKKVFQVGTPLLLE